MTPYEQLLARLLPARRFGVVLGLERMHDIFAKLGHPERRLGRVVHVGGTNGKGSTVKFIADLLRHEGHVATYTSPHLSTLRERIRFDDEPITEDAIVDAAAQVTSAGGDELTFFEQLTAIGVVAIAARGVDFTVLEVGLGGRLDATNAVAAEVAVVTGVAMDHAAILGDTLDKIALEKAGIFKPKQQVVIGMSGERAALGALVEAARRVTSHVTVVGDADVATADASHLPAALGAFQKRNAANAMVAVRALGIDARLHLRALRPPPGRFELIERDDVDVVLDGAHNPHAAKALAAELRARQLDPVLIVAASSDKDVAGIVEALTPIARGVIATRYQQDRALAPAELAAMFDRVLANQTTPNDAPMGWGVPVEAATTLTAAIAAATRIALHEFHPTVVHPRPTIVITGSLFLVGEARTLLLNAPTDPYVVTDPPAKP